MSDLWHERIKNKNREEIISAARKLFLKNNFLNINIKDICASAGISRVTFYKHFKSIDELIFEIQMDILNTMTDFIISRDNLGFSGIERIKLILYAWIDFAKENQDKIKYIILFDLYYNAYDSNKELKIKYDRFINNEEHADFLNSAINKGIADGTMRSDLDPVKAGYYIFQIIMGVLQRMSCTNLPEKYAVVTFTDIVNSVVDIIINYVAIPK